MEPIVKIVHDGVRNASVQITGRAPLDWTVVVDLEAFRPRPRDVRLDAVYFAVSGPVEVQLAWASDGERLPFLPLAGRGKVDFSEVTGLHNSHDDANGHIELAAYGEGIFTVALDLSKHTSG